MMQGTCNEASAHWHISRCSIRSLEFKVQFEFTQADAKTNP